MIRSKTKSNQQNTNNNKTKGKIRQAKDNKNFACLTEEQNENAQNTSPVAWHGLAGVAWQFGGWHA